MTTRKNARATNNAHTNEYTSINVIDDNEHAMMIAHNASCDTHDASHDAHDDDTHDAHDNDALFDEYAMRDTTTTTNTNDDASITRARITRKLTKRDRAMLRKIARDENTNVAHEHNTRWHDVVFDVRVLQRLNIDHRVID